MSILLDGHVHVHPAFDLDQMLDGAWRNFSQVASRLLADVANCSYVLLLAEGNGADAFATLLARAGQGNSGRAAAWNIRPTAEPDSLLAAKGEKKIILIAGRQLISRERLELLSLFCPHVFSDNTFSLSELAERVVEKGGVPLLAWGVGKWFGRRGRVVQEFLADPPVPVFLVGDNGNRPWFWPYPALLAEAEGLGIAALAGSDPLPLANHACRAGSYGGLIKDAVLGEENPARTLKKILWAGEEILPFGKGAGLLQFVFDQLRVNVQKRLRTPADN